MQQPADASGSRHASALNVRHRCGRIARSCGRVLWNRSVQLVEIQAIESHFRGASILLNVTALLRAKNRDDVGALREKPCERELRERALLARRDRFKPANDLEIVVEVLRLKPREDPTAIALRQV